MRATKCWACAGVCAVGSLIHRDLLLPGRSRHSFLWPHEQRPPVPVDTHHTECLQVRDVNDASDSQALTSPSPCVAWTRCCKSFKRFDMQGDGLWLLKMKCLLSFVLGHARPYRIQFVVSLLFKKHQLVMCIWLLESSRHFPNGTHEERLRCMLSTLQPHAAQELQVSICGRCWAG